MRLCADCLDLDGDVYCPNIDANGEHVRRPVIGSSLAVKHVADAGHVSRAFRFMSQRDDELNRRASHTFYTREVQAAGDEIVRRAVIELEDA